MYAYPTNGQTHSVESQVVEAMGFRQFLKTLTPDEFAHVMALNLGYTQAEVADVFGVSAPTVNRTINSIRRKFAAWHIS